MANEQRLDAALVARGLCGGRDKAKRLIAGGAVSVNGKTVTKAAFAVADSDEIACSVKERFIGRGGEKLEKVLSEYGLPVSGACCADIGASTGGFTDCLLQHGAQRVYAMDVGHGQLHETLRTDPRVVCMEGVDVRNREAVGIQIADGTVQICVIDVSFISLTQIWDSITPLLSANAAVVCLIKPQFEAGRAALSKRGVVRKAQDHVRVIDGLLRFWNERAWTPHYLSWSPIKGGEGNIEYLAVLTKTGQSALLPPVKELVRQAAAALTGE